MQGCTCTVPKMPVALLLIIRQCLRDIIGCHTFGAAPESSPPVTTYLYSHIQANSSACCSEAGLGRPCTPGYRIDYDGEPVAREIYQCHTFNHTALPGEIAMLARSNSTSCQGVDVREQSACEDTLASQKIPRRTAPLRLRYEHSSVGVASNFRTGHESKVCLVQQISMPTCPSSSISKPPGPSL